MTDEQPFDVLAKLLKPYAKKMIVKTDTDTNFYLDLLKRMQGKSCFNFKTVEQIPVKDVKQLLQRAYDSLDS